MDKTYNHKDHEEKIYALWEKSGVFTPKIQKNKEPFTIILPPPNANAALHYGHAMYTIEDILIRWHRMRGDPTLWVPGADHAGFETQVVFEKHLAKKGQSRFDFDRPTLYQMIWDFVQENRVIMESQLKKLGFSLDWSRKKFTLDPDLVKTTQTTFKKLFDDGLVYRDTRLVNYCTKHGTGFSDLEISDPEGHEERDDELYFIQFPTAETNKNLTVATTRPETIPGDVAVAVHPNDKRYQKFIGKAALNPVNHKPLPIIADAFVDRKFGTGVVKITPAHDENDFLVAKKHNLPLIQVIGFNGRLTPEAGQFTGLKVADARIQVLDYLKQKGYLVKQIKYRHTVPVCYKCKTLLEPLPVPQWYIKTQPLAEKAVSAVKKGQIQVIPKRFEKVYFHWLKNIQDWNISRQIVWGIPIPAWQCDNCSTWIVTDGKSPTKCTACASKKLKQDPDTFDTWFSSGQWPFSILGYPDRPDYKYFYPTSLLETGYDILFFWVARMVMLGLYITQQVPFRAVYLHGLILDPKGQKMSKSKGNVVNPMEIAERFGADAVRFSLVAGAAAGNDQNYSESKVVGYRNFANKVWNIARFVLSSPESKNSPSTINTDDKWIMSELKKTTQKVTQALKNYRLNQAAEQIYDFIWHRFADKYLEAVKSRRDEAQPTLKFVLEQSLKLLHPFMPFVTEAIWQQGFAKSKKDLLILAKWPNN